MLKYLEFVYYDSFFCYQIITLMKFYAKQKYIV